MGRYRGMNGYVEKVNKGGQVNCWILLAAKIIKYQHASPLRGGFAKDRVGKEVPKLGDRYRIGCAC